MKFYFPLSNLLHYITSLLTQSEINKHMYVCLYVDGSECSAVSEGEDCEEDMAVTNGCEGMEIESESPEVN